MDESRRREPGSTQTQPAAAAVTPRGPLREAIRAPENEQIRRMNRAQVSREIERLRRELGVCGGIGRVGEGVARDPSSLECQRGDLAALAVVARVKSRMWRPGGERPATVALPKLQDSFEKA